MIDTIRALFQDAQSRRARLAACAAVAVVSASTGVAAHFGFVAALVVAVLVVPATLYATARKARLSLLVLPLACVLAVAAVVRLFSGKSRP